MKVQYDPRYGIFQCMKKKTELLLSLVFSSACRMHAAVNLRLFVSFLLLLDVG